MQVSICRYIPLFILNIYSKEESVSHMGKCTISIPLQETAKVFSGMAAPLGIPTTIYESQCSASSLVSLILPAFKKAIRLFPVLPVGG